MNCPQCGYDFAPGMNFCPSCGLDLKNVVRKPPAPPQRYPTQTQPSPPSGRVRRSTDTSRRTESPASFQERSYSEQKYRTQEPPNYNYPDYDEPPRSNVPRTTNAPRKTGDERYPSASRQNAPRSYDNEYYPETYTSRTPQRPPVQKNYPAAPPKADPYSEGYSYSNTRPDPYENHGRYPQKQSDNAPRKIYEHTPASVGRSRAQLTERETSFRVPEQESEEDWWEKAKRSDSTAVYPRSYDEPQPPRRSSSYIPDEAEVPLPPRYQKKTPVRNPLMPDDSDYDDDDEDDFEDTPFYQRWWFILLAIILLMAGTITALHAASIIDLKQVPAFFSSLTGGSESETEGEDSDPGENEDPSSGQDEQNEGNDELIGDAVADAIYEMGATVESGGFDICVASFSVSSGSGSDTPKDGMEYVMISVEVTNVGESSSFLNPYYFTMSNSKGEILDPISVRLDGDNPLSNVELDPEEAVTGTLIFEQPVNDPELIVLFSPNNSLRAEIGFELID